MTAGKYADACAGGRVAVVMGMRVLPIDRAIGCADRAMTASQLVAPSFRVGVREAG